MRAQFVLFNGFDPLDVIAPYEVLGAGGVEVQLVSAEGPRDVPSGIGLSLKATARLGQADITVVPGAAGPDQETITAHLAATLQTELPALLKESGAITATVCGGSLVLAMAGLITGRTATTHHDGMGALAAAGVTAVPARVVDDGDLVSAAGVTSGLDLALYLLEREVGPTAALRVERLIAHERRGVVWSAR